MNRHERRKAAKVQKPADPGPEVRLDKFPGELAIRLVLAQQRAVAAADKFQALMEQVVTISSENGKYKILGIKIDEKTDEVFVQRQLATAAELAAASTATAPESAAAPTEPEAPSPAAPAEAAAPTASAVAPAEATAPAEA